MRVSCQSVGGAVGQWSWQTLPMHVFASPALSPTVHVVEHCLKASEQNKSLCGTVTSAPMGTQSHVQRCEVDVCKTHGMDQVGIAHSVSVPLPIRVTLGFARLVIAVWHS